MSLRGGSPCPAMSVGVLLNADGSIDEFDIVASRVDVTYRCHIPHYFRPRFGYHTGIVQVSYACHTGTVQTLFSWLQVSYIYRADFVYVSYRCRAVAQ